MTQFKPGDRVEYVGSADGDFSRSFVGDKATVTDADNQYITGLEWDDGRTGSAWTKNLKLIESAEMVVASAKADVIEKYVSEFERIVNNGTHVPRYTALGFLTEFLREWDGAK